MSCVCHGAGVLCLKEHLVRDEQCELAPCPECAEGPTAVIKMWQPYPDGCLTVFQIFIERKGEEPLFMSSRSFGTRQDAQAFADSFNRESIAVRDVVVKILEASQ